MKTARQHLVEAAEYVENAIKESAMEKKHAKQEKPAKKIEVSEPEATAFPSFCCGTLLRNELGNCATCGGDPSDPTRQPIQGDM